MADVSRSAEATAEKLVQSGVSDPDSTQFRNVMAYRVGLESERWVCGWFNAKTPAGEFLGYRRFVVHVLLTDHATGDGSTVSTHLLISETEVPSLSVRLGKLLPMTAAISFLPLPARADETWPYRCRNPGIARCRKVRRSGCRAPSLPRAIHAPRRR